MADIIKLETRRLVLRQWREEDMKTFSMINADPMVMEYYPGILDSKQSNDLAYKIKGRIEENGWGFWAVELKNSNAFIGFVGLNKPSYELPVTPCVEIGWRLSQKHWGQGYATEAAQKCLEVAFCQLNFSEVYSFTPVQNKRSEAVMLRLNMLNMQKNFAHPIIPKGSSLREHVLYKITQQAWKNSELN